MSNFFYGLSTGFSLIVGLGAQNAFVLKQGLTRQYIFWVCLICALSDCLLIYIGVNGFSHLQNFPNVLLAVKYFGVAFLLAYGARSFYLAYADQSALNPSDIQKNSLLKVLGLCLALTWLNPHVYLDTVLLMGAIALQFHDNLIAFTLGAMLASWIFFFLLGYGARYLRPFFASAKAWKGLNFCIGLLMWAIALRLLLL